MPTAPLRPCAAPGCRGLVPYGRCKAHTQQRERDRGSAHERGYDRDWSKLSIIFRREHPFCADCELRGIVKASKCVDHVIPHRGNESLRMDRDNLRALCWACHSVKTAKYDRGFGRASKQH